MRTTVGALLRATVAACPGGVERLDAELLLAYALDLERVDVVTAPDRLLTATEVARFRDLARQRSDGVPLAYLVGEREFFGRSFLVEPGVLVPRPETEMLVERALAHRPERLLDVGTGSGCIAISCLCESPSLRAVAIDSSAVALDVARRNAERHDVATRLDLRSGDLFAALAVDAAIFDVIVSNPPYVALGDAQAVARHEPHEALFAGADGLAVLRRLFAEAGRWLVAGGVLLCEIGEDQGVSAAALARAHFSAVEILRDLAGHPRVVLATGQTAT